MYLEYYKLKEYPFTIACDERYFFESSIHAEALASMLYCFQQRKGMILVSGEVGAGKTFLGNMLTSRLGPSCQGVFLSHPPQSARQMVRAVATGAGLNLHQAGITDKQDIVEALLDHLTRMHHRGRLVALIIDECQDLSKSALEEIRLLWNWELQGQRLLQILLIGQPELRERLLEPKWESLRQRIVLSYHLGNLSAADTVAYVAHRLRIAAQDGTQGWLTFLPEALAEIHAATDGIPRLVNVLCDNALLVGYGREVRIIDVPIIHDVLRDMTCWGLRARPEVSLQVSATGST